MTQGARWFRGVAVATAVVVTGLVGGTATAASTSGAAPLPEGVSMEGTGPPVPEVGVLSKAALAQDGCATNGRTTFTYAGGGPWCVDPWPDGKDNGGATAQGVTPTTVKVVIYVPNDQMAASDTSVKNQATGGRTTLTDIVNDTGKVYEKLIAQNGTYQTWGRKLVVDTLVASGPDEAAQRADAVEAIAAKPFFVVDMINTGAGGAPVFSSVVADKKIIVASASTNAQNATAQSPYRWNYGADPSSGPAIVAALIGKALTGKKAEWAGDAALKSKTRSFGAVYPTTGFDLDAFEKFLSQNGGKLTDKVAYDPATATTGSAELTTLVSHLKSAGVTSVALFTVPTVTAAVMAAATEQQYFPEWVFTGYGYSEFDGFARTNDQKQMAHAFGTVILGPAVTGAPTSLNAFPWYWGSSAGSTDSTMGASFQFVYNAMHYAGPKLTAANVKKGLYAAPAVSTVGATSASIGMSGYGKTVGLPYDEFALFGSDRALAWWDGETSGPAQATLGVDKGVFQYLNNGASVGYSDITKTTPKFFDKSASVFQRAASDFFPGNVVPTALPCTGCPSSGGSASTS